MIEIIDLANEIIRLNEFYGEVILIVYEKGNYKNELGFSENYYIK